MWCQRNVYLQDEGVVVVVVVVCGRRCVCVSVCVFEVVEVFCVRVHVG